MRYEDIDRSAMAPCPFCGQQGEYYIEDITDYHIDDILWDRNMGWTAFTEINVRH